MSSNIMEVTREQLGKLKHQLAQLPDIRNLPVTNPYEVFRMKYRKELIVGYTSDKHSSCKVVVNGSLTRKLVADLIGVPKSTEHDLHIDDSFRPYYIANIDGLCEPKNPGGIGSYGLVIYSNSRKIYEDKKVVGKGRRISNNVAEYSALVALLQYLNKNNIKGDVLVRSDSKLVVYQMNGEWGIKDGLYVDKWYEARKLMKDLQNKLRFEWIEREKNSEADKLSREAYEEYCKKHGIEPKYHEDDDR